MNVNTGFEGNGARQKLLTCRQGIELLGCELHVLCVGEVEAIFRQQTADTFGRGRAGNGETWDGMKIAAGEEPRGGDRGLTLRGQAHSGYP